MSRSYKKYPVVKDGYKSKWKRFAKRQSNKKIRKKLKDAGVGISDGGAYKSRYYGLNPWDICDYIFWVTRPRDPSSSFDSQEDYRDFVKAKRK